jgi:hypothetical protein
MKKMLLVSVALLAGFAVVLIKLTLELRAERQGSSELRAQLDEARVARPLAAAPTQMAAVPGAVAPSAACASSPVQPAPSPAEVDMAMRASTTAALSASTVAAITGSTEQDLMKDPEYRKAQLTITRMKLSQSNPGLAQALGISEKEANHYFEVMAEQQLKMTAEMSSAVAAGGSPALSIDDSMRRARSLTDVLREAMGDARFAQYQEYQVNVRPALTQVSSIGSVLTAAGQPLNESQSRALASTMLAEQQRQRQEAMTPRAAAPTPGVARGIADMLEESNQRQDESNRRILEASAGYLNGAQMEALKTRYEQQAAQRRRTVESAKDMDARRPIALQPSVPPPAPR